MNIPNEINRQLNNCAQQTTGPQRRVNIEGLSRYIENTSKKRLGDLTAFVDALGELGLDHPNTWACGHPADRGRVQ